MDGEWVAREDERKMGGDWDAGIERTRLVGFVEFGTDI